MLAINVQIPILVVALQAPVQLLSQQFLKKSRDPDPPVPVYNVRMFLSRCNYLWK